MAAADAMERDPYLRASLASYLDDGIMNDTFNPEFTEQNDMMHIEPFFPQSLLPDTTNTSSTTSTFDPTQLHISVDVLPTNNIVSSLVKKEFVPPSPPDSAHDGSYWDGSGSSDDDSHPLLAHRNNNNNTNNNNSNNNNNNSTDHPQQQFGNVADSPINRSTPPPTPAIEQHTSHPSMLQFPDWGPTTDIKVDKDSVNPVYVNVNSTKVAKNNSAVHQQQQPQQPQHHHHQQQQQQQQRTMLSSISSTPTLGNSPLVSNTMCVKANTTTASTKKSSARITAHTSSKIGGPSGARKKVADAAESQRKRTLHNAIERRYRNNINDKITELKSCLPKSMTSDDKMNKSTVIQKGIDYIKYLEAALQNQQQGGIPAQAIPATDGDGGNRMLMCVLGCGLMLYLTPSTALVRNGQHHGSARVLTSIQAMDEGQGLGLDDTASLEAMLAMVFWYSLRTCAFLLCVFLVFKRDMVTDPNDARENAKKCTEALRHRNIIKAKHHGTKALELLGLAVPTTYWRLVVGNICLSVRQVLHRFYFGQWIDSYLVSLSDSAVATEAVVANMTHALHQMELLSDSVTTSKWKLMTQSHLALRALNAAESVQSQLTPATMLKIYVSCAIQMELTLQFDLASIASNYYLRQARRIYHQSPQAVQQLGWMFKPNGDKFFRQGSWCTKVVNGPHGQRYHPGSFEQLTSAFHLDLLEQGLRELSLGVDSDRVHDLFIDLKDSAILCQDEAKQWWGVMGLVLIAWRRGRKTEAGKHLTELEQLEFADMTRTQKFIQAASQGHQALLEGDHEVCWQALELASSQSNLISADSSDTRDSDDELEVTNLARLLGFHQLLSTRVALIRLRSYLEQDSSSVVPTIRNHHHGEVITKAAMLSAIQQDTNRLRAVSEVLPLAQSAVFKYQAIHRSLSGGRVALTERIFYKSLKTAQEHGLPFEEASVLLHSAVYLRATMSARAFKLSLSKAASIFEKLQATEELCTSRKLLQLAMYN